MKKIYFLFYLLAVTVSAIAQTTTVDIFCENTGTNKTGYTNGTTTTTGNIKSTSGTTTIDRGYAVFSLSPATPLPAGTIITSCTVGIRVNTYGGSGTPSGWATYGYNGDLSTVSTSTSLYSDCVSGTLLSNATYGTGVANTIIPSTPQLVAFANANIDSVISLSFTGGASRVYTITGYTGGTSPTGTGHRPYIELSYCTGVTGVSATATPNPVCTGSTLTLTGAGSGISSYSWSGPGGFTSAVESPTLTATSAAAGVYTFTAYNSGGCATTVTTSLVIVNSGPGPISGPSHVCVGDTVSLSDAALSGTWSSSASAIASITSLGVVTGRVPGPVTITYTCGSSATYTVTVRATPEAISGTDTVCQGSTTTFSDTGSGTWSSMPTAIATIGSSTGIAGGISSGPATITYTSAVTGCHATSSIYVTPAPDPITGTPNECVGLTTTLAEAISGGTWSSSNSLIASVSSLGVVTGLVPGSVVISYRNTCGTATIFNNVKSLPGPIAGRDSVCLYGFANLSDDIDGGTWTSSNPAVATVPSDTSGSISAAGLSVGTDTITYILPTGCQRSTTFTVISLPPPIGAPSLLCPGIPGTISDAEPGGTWSTDDTFVVNITNSSVAGQGIITGVNVDTATISYTMPEGCFVTALVAVNPLPDTITGVQVVCAGIADTLADGTPGGTWSSSNASIASVSTLGVLTGVDGGTATITYTLPTGCYVTVSDLTHTLPNPSVSYNGFDETFTADSGYSSYQWYTATSLADTVLLTGAVSYNVAAIFNDLYYIVVVTDSFGCVNASVPYYLSDLAVSKTSVPSISIYPNPASIMINIIAPASARFEITDMSGNTVIKGSAPGQVDIAKLPAGSYLVSFYTSAGDMLPTRKFIKE